MDQPEVDRAAIWDEVAIDFFRPPGDRRYYTRSKGKGAGKVGVIDYDKDKLIRWCEALGMGTVIQVGSCTQPGKDGAYVWAVGRKVAVIEFTRRLQERVMKLCAHSMRPWAAETLAIVRTRAEMTRDRMPTRSATESPRTIYRPSWGFVESEWLDKLEGRTSYEPVKFVPHGEGKVAVPRSHTSHAYIAAMPIQGPAVGMCGQCGKEHEVGTIADIVAKRFKCEQ